MARMGRTEVKLFSVVAFMSLMLIVVGGAGFYVAKRANAGLETVYNDRVVCMEQLKNVSDAYGNNIIDSPHKVLDGSMSWDEARKKLAEARQEIDKEWKAYTATYLVPEEKNLVDEAAPLMPKADEAVTRLDAILAKGDREALSRFVGKELYPAVDPVTTKLEQLMNLQVRVAKQVYERSEGRYNNGRMATLILLVMSIVASSLFGRKIIKGVYCQLGAEPDYVREIAVIVSQGDLSCTIATDPRDQGSLLWAMKKMVENLREMITSTAAISESIASASSQLQSTSEQIATGAEEVAAQTVTVATASEEMAVTSGDIARSCALAAENSTKSSESAQNGAAIVQETIAGMNKIAERVKDTAGTIDALGARSEQIGEIIGTIEDIADQTNLLALNAAIEAARAGEQGRGFAVVADEVRALAERTTKATREIGEMIKAIQAETHAAVRTMEEGVREVERGASSSKKSGEALQDILNEINEVTMQVNQIATAAEEQTATTSEITSNIHQITDVVQQTARGAEETSLSSANLARHAQQLRAMVSRFRLA